MFQIQRYEIEQEPLQDVSTVSTERLSKINERIQLKRKRSLKKNNQAQQANEDKESGFIKKEINEKGGSFQEVASTEKISKNIHEDLRQKETIKKHPVLQAFPTFDRPKQTPQEIAAAKLLGIPDWLANPTIIDSNSTKVIGHPSIGLSEGLVKRCNTYGIQECFAVQMAVIPLLIHSRNLSDTHKSPGDICVSAPTGSGKTLAYVLPIIDILSKRIVTRLRVLVVLPTRDLVIQVKETFDAFCKGTNLKVGIVTGQQSFTHEQEQIVGDLKGHFIGGKSKVDILIATPGRLIEHLSTTPNFTLQHLRFLIIDEADRLLNQSYHDWLSHILKSTQLKQAAVNTSRKTSMEIKFDSFGVPISDAVSAVMMESILHIPKGDISEPKTSAIQKLLFSATLTRNPAKIASLHLVNPQYISVQSINKNEGEFKYVLPSSLNEYMIVSTSSEKPLMILHLLHNHHISSALCFTKSVDSSHRLSELIRIFEILYSQTLKKEIKEIEINNIQKTNENSDFVKSIIAAEYSSDLSQEERKNILNKFKHGEIQLLICSDLIARGIDIDRVDTVINYDVPIYMKKYVHRVGRTARAGRKGDAYSIVETQEAGHLDKIKNVNIKPIKLEPLKVIYKKSLEAFREYMVNTRSSVTKYKDKFSSIDINEIQEIGQDDQIIIE
ncbi:44759_t:CDS:10 [Gigaspora margarita]|uniref:RNA helicase n=1 Tax=Gigaspora margarita TaxID=4874 RepID=A0ABN7VY58_GIGMA|nr:44759_t:CDS:10 [Gigaspora margarita]